MCVCAYIVSSRTQVKQASLPDFFLVEFQKTNLTGLFFLCLKPAAMHTHLYHCQQRQLE